jgi:ABC-type multidrug transport system ATPase subunit
VTDNSNKWGGEESPPQQGPISREERWELRECALRLIESLTGQGVAIVSVFHDADAIARLATRVLVLVGGQIAADGPPGQALAALASFTASATEVTA